MLQIEHRLNGEVDGVADPSGSIIVLPETVARHLKVTEDGTVSTDDVIRKTRSRFPGLSVRDEDLISLIATRAAAHGRAVEFDHSLRS